MANKLELTWIGKDEPVKVEPRLLIEDASRSNIKTAPDTENMLIHGDNLLALKALEAKYAGQVKCIYIDPPYNTGSAFNHYDDNLEHSIWLNLMSSRLAILRNLLSKMGTIWISLDDNEAHYLKVLCDETFGRKNFIADVAWEKADSPRMDAKLFSTRYDHTLVYAKSMDVVDINPVKTTEIPEHYNKTEADGRRYYLKPLRYMGAGDERDARPNLYYGIIAPDGTEVYPKRADGTDGRWRWSKERTEQSKDRLEWVRTKRGWSLYSKIYAELGATRPPETLWSFQFAGSNRNAKAEINALFGKKSFDTPKPERLIEVVLSVATNPGDLVLDSFLGSGTTAAVAHKMGRRYIGIEMGDHAYTHCKVRLDKVIAGEDAGGITKSVNWQGGGGYRFYELAPTLINQDAFGEYVINKEYDANMLAAGVALHEGFHYHPDETLFWKQSHGSEKSFLFVTTRHVTADYLAAIHGTMQEDEYLIIACRSYDSGVEKICSNITINKIPQMLLQRCEFNKDNYNLNIVRPPVYEDDVDEEVCHE